MGRTAGATRYQAATAGFPESPLVHEGELSLPARFASLMEARLGDSALILGGSFHAVVALWPI